MANKVTSEQLFQLSRDLIRWCEYQNNETPKLINQVNNIPDDDEEYARFKDEWNEDMNHFKNFVQRMEQYYNTFLSKKAERLQFYEQTILNGTL